VHRFGLQAAPAALRYLATSEGLSRARHYWQTRTGTIYVHDGSNLAAFALNFAQVASATSQVWADRPGLWWPRNRPPRSNRSSLQGSQPGAMDTLKMHVFSRRASMDHAQRIEETIYVAEVATIALGLFVLKIVGLP